MAAPRVRVTINREEREQGWIQQGKKSAVDGKLGDTGPSKAIPGWSGNVRNWNDTFGMSQGTVLNQQYSGELVRLGQQSRPNQGTAGATFLSANGQDGAVWDHKYLTTSQVTNSVIEAQFRQSQENNGLKSYTGHFSSMNPTPSIVGFTGHVHRAHEALGASYETAQKIAQEALAEHRSQVKPPVENTKHWSQYFAEKKTAAGKATDLDWKSEYALSLATRASGPRKIVNPEVEQRNKTLREKAALTEEHRTLTEAGLSIADADANGGDTSPMVARLREEIGAARNQSFSHKYAKTSTQELDPFQAALNAPVQGPKAEAGEEGYTGFFASGSGNKRIVGYSGHIPNAPDKLGRTFGRVEREAEAEAGAKGLRGTGTTFVRDPPHPLGGRYPR